MKSIQELGYFGWEKPINKIRVNILDAMRFTINEMLILKLQL